MAGLCWFVQVVHYPLFREIPLADFPKYERKNFVTGFVTVPVMTIELATGLYLLYHKYTSLLCQHRLIRAHSPQYGYFSGAYPFKAYQVCYKRTD